MKHAVSRRDVFLGLGLALPAAALVTLTASEAEAKGGRGGQGSRRGGRDPKKDKRRKELVGDKSYKN